MNALLVFRKKAGVSQSRIAGLAGVSQASIHSLEQGGVDPSLGRARNIVRALNQLGVEASLDEVFPPEEPVRQVA